MKVFMTGSTGVIGRRAVPRLIEASHQVTAVVRTLDKRAILERMGAKTVDVSLFDRGGLHDAIAGHDAVVNLATHMPSSSLRMLLRREWVENDRIRREGSANLVDAAIAGGVQRFVQESFAPAYPDRANAWIDESVSLQPEPYNRTIEDAERSAGRFAGGGRSGVVVRFAAFYGPDARHVGDMIRLVRLGWAPIPGDPGAFVSSIAHDDAASAVVAALGLPAGIYNVTDDDPVSHREYVDSLAAALGVRTPRLPPPWSTFLFGSAGRLLARSLRISNRKLREGSDWRPKYPSVREGWRSLTATSLSSPPFHQAPAH